MIALLSVARLAVIGYDDRLMALETKPDDPGERRIDDTESDPLASLDGYVAGNPPIDRDGVADPARHPRFHAIAEAGGDPSVIVEPPILNDPQEVAIDRDQLTFLDDQSAGQTASKLLQRVGVRVIPEGARIGRRELIHEALAGSDRLLRHAGHPIHRVRQADAVPMDGCVLAELVLDGQPDRFALANPKFRAGHGAVVGPHNGIR